MDSTVSVHGLKGLKRAIYGNKPIYFAVVTLLFQLLAKHSSVALQCK